eukprot:SAG31_NODE_1513_length_8045_cov_5.748804_4_plen_459_part_00
MWNAAHVKEVVAGAEAYGLYGEDRDTLETSSFPQFQFDWKKVKSSRDSYVERLNGIYKRNLDNSGVTLLRGEASFCGKQTITVAGIQYTADHILIAVGGRPTLPSADIVPGASEYGIDSDGFFELESLPKKAAVVGAGYIAVELAGVLNTLGSSVDLFVRGGGALRRFDSEISAFLNKQMVADGIDLVTESNLSGVDKQHDGTLSLNAKVAGEAVTRDGYDCLIFAVGRQPAVEVLRLDIPGVEQHASGHVVVDEYQQTTADGVYALGDVCGVDELTPVAIAAGRRLADRLFGGPEYADAKIKYGEVPTVVFSHPPIGTIGLTEAEAEARYGGDNLKIYRSTFVNMFYAVYDIPPADKPKSFVKLICAGPEETVVGLHIIGMAADEIVQGFGVSMRMGATKSDFDNCIAIHPTAAEEVVSISIQHHLNMRALVTLLPPYQVTLAPWGKGGMASNEPIR